MFSEVVKKDLEKQGYRLVGNHSACKICTWTRKSLLDKDVCYKQKFYGIESHRCCQMTPCMTCCNRCVYCWRDTSGFSGKSQFNKQQQDKPTDIIKNCINAQKLLLSGFGGNKNVNPKKLKEAQEPKHFAISLSGEPFLYPKLGELIKELHDQDKTTFLVTNGQLPKEIKSLKEMPTQFYLSLDAPNKKVYKELDKPLFSDYWERLNNTLELLKGLKTRRVLRLTLIKQKNMRDIKGYTSLIKKAEPDFVEVKGYMFVGYSRHRLEMKNMPLHIEVKNFAEKLAKASSLNFLNEKKESRVVLLGDKN